MNVNIRELRPSDMRAGTQLVLRDCNALLSSQRFRFSTPMGGGYLLQLAEGTAGECIDLSSGNLSPHVHVMHMYGFLQLHVRRSMYRVYVYCCMRAFQGG